MKLPTTWLLVLALCAIGIAGCGPQTSTPPITTAGTRPPAAAPQPAPVRIEPLPKQEAPFKVEAKEWTGTKAPFAPSPAIETGAEAPPATAAALESKPPEKPKSSESAPTRPKADREPTRPGDPEKITFDDLILGMQADMVYRPFMLTERAKELEGKRVRLSGNMLPYDGTKAKKFIILRNKECKYGAGGQADHVADVLLKEGHKATFTLDTIRVEGTLRISPVNGDDGNTKHIYVLEDALMK